VIRRIVTGILAVVFLPLGIAFLVIGLAVDEPRSGEPEAFLYLGAALAAVGVAFATTFIVLSRREAARRRRRREGLRARAEIVEADVNWSVRVNGRPALRLTVRFQPAGTVSGTFLAGGSYDLAVGETIEVLYDPAEPSNFEPAGVASGRTRRAGTA
jgi:hypothetical protein